MEPTKQFRACLRLFKWLQTAEWCRSFPDASWVRRVSEAAPEERRWDALTSEEQQGFAPLCPDFVVELLSSNDSVKIAQAKMREYMENGARLGWLINRKNQRVEIYCQGQDVEITENPTTLSGEDVLPGFVLDLKQIM